MLVDNIALRAPLRLSSRKKTDDPYAMLEARFTPRTVFMEVGSPDASLALRAAGYVERVYAIDVSGHLVQNVRAPSNLRIVLCDGMGGYEAGEVAAAMTIQFIRKQLAQMRPFSVAAGESPFLTDPQGYAPGTKMNFNGLRDVQDRANLIAYLDSLDG